MGKAYDRGLLLYEQERWDLALQEFRADLTDEPNNGRSQAFAALCLKALGRLGPATEVAREAISLEPHEPFCYYALALIFKERNRFKEAQDAITQALELRPDHAEYLGLAALLWAQQKEWQRALELATRGLELQPTNRLCGHARALALVKTGKMAQARELLDAMLERDPDNALVQANLGWVALERNDREAALRAFRESLRIDPELEWSRDGLVEALKLRYPLYGMLLRYFLWMGRRKPSERWAVAGGLYMLHRALSEFARRNPRVKPWLMPFLWCYRLFAYFTWVGRPFGNLLLRATAYGRGVLTPDETVESNLFGGLLFGSVASMAAFKVTHAEAWLLIFLVCFTLPIPLTATYTCEDGWPRQLMKVFTLSLTILGIVTVIDFALWEEAERWLKMLEWYVLGIVASQWIGNVLAGVTPKK
jgi:tetratricopeptide (TPR) repeat protein